MRDRRCDEGRVKLKSPIYKDLMALSGVGRLSVEDALDHIGQLIDACRMPRHAPGITKALEWCSELEARGLEPVQLTALEYFRSNAWDHRRPRYRQGGDAWKWEQPALQEENSKPAACALRRRLQGRPCSFAMLDPDQSGQCTQRGRSRDRSVGAAAKRNRRRTSFLDGPGNPWDGPLQLRPRDPQRIPCRRALLCRRPRTERKRSRMRMPTRTSDTMKRARVLSAKRPGSTNTSISPSSPSISPRIKEAWESHGLSVLIAPGA